ncbi:MAG: TetR/AcrR family transcriptional regulator [Gemmatimonadota bacterium]
MSEPAPRWRRRPTERPEEILRAALDVFVEEGLAGARVEDIAQRAGVSKGTLYLYFQGKEELFREAILAHVGRTLETLSTASAPGDARERLARFLAAYWAVMRGPRFAGLYRLVLAELHQFPDLTRFWADEISGRAIALLMPVLEEGAREGVFRLLDARVAGRMIAALLGQHAVWASRRDLFPHLRQKDDEELLSEISEFAFAALGAAPPSQDLLR